MTTRPTATPAAPPRPSPHSTSTPPPPGAPSRGGDAALPQDQFVGVTMIVLTLAGWTSIPLFLRHFASQIDLWTSNGWRYGAAALVWAPVVLLGAMRKTLPPGLWRKALLPAGLNSVAQVFFTGAFYHLDPAMAAFGLRSNIIFASIGAAILFAAERRVIRSTGFLIGMLMVIAGTCGTLLLDDSFGEKSSAVGITYAVIAGALYAAYALAVRICMKGIPTLVSFSAISVYTAAAMVALMLAFGERSGAAAIDLSPTQFALLMVSALVGIAMGHVTYYLSIARLGVAVSAGVIQLQPFTVAAISAPLFGELLTGPQWALGAVAVAGTILMLIVQNRMAARFAAQSRPLPEMEPDADAAACRAAADE